MLPRELHVEQINRFHDKLKEMSDAIEACGEDPDKKDLKGELCLEYFHMTELWCKIDNLVEMDIKVKLDSMESE